jgi:hypothetical protein
MTKGSNYNLGMSLMYLRLAYQSMSKDQEEARLAVGRVVRAEATTEERLRALAEIVAAKVKTLEPTQ